LSARQRHASDAPPAALPKFAAAVALRDPNLTPTHWKTIRDNLAGIEYVLERPPDEEPNDVLTVTRLCSRVNRDLRARLATPPI